ncbi:GNAT family N-acetyltransferase [Corynebacterium lowii]|uniref:Spermidine N(1)-acetyltransferase n=1 Tax=Corynebacterium lowii TaxID=1544413 RepID=A0A0Q0UL86_9CORY|nr:GNAT family protein [Corynebacterium lowii]KQB87089.1 Spermidine N(1)-acetyltransferase [Corynebacterium lowii]MDP9852326.1 RimJ/RimL family protein N-acetyltransferase [Corynebacterium lowii]
MTDFTTLRTWGQGILRGEKVSLRPLHSDDLPTLTQWWRDTGEAMLQQDRLALRPTDAIAEMFTQWSSNDSPSGAGYSIMDGSGTLVGHLTLWGMALPTRIATLAIMIGPDHQEQGYGRDAMKVALRLAFEEMGAHKVELQTPEYNTRALGLYTSLGFVEEGRRRAAIFHQSRFYDHVQLGILAEEYALIRQESAQ